MISGETLCPICKKVLNFKFVKDRVYSFRESVPYMRVHCDHPEKQLFYVCRIYSDKYSCYEIVYNINCTLEFENYINESYVTLNNRTLKVPTLDLSNWKEILSLI